MIEEKWKEPKEIKLLLRSILEQCDGEKYSKKEAIHGNLSIAGSFSNANYISLNKALKKPKTHQKLVSSI